MSGEGRWGTVVFSGTFHFLLGLSTPFPQDPLWLHGLYHEAL